MGEFIDLIAEKVSKKNGSKREWLVKNAENLKRYDIVTHVGKYTNPDITELHLWDDSRDDDAGYVTTASVEQRQDIVVDGGAAFTGLASILVRTLEDGKTVLEHFQEDTPFIRKEVASLGENYEALRQKILSVQRPNQPKRSSPYIKQVYFPVGADQYHILSLVTSTTVLTALRDTVRTQRETAFKCRNQKLIPEGAAYTEIPQPARVAFGGANAQNISALNTSYGAFMLMSLPPLIPPRTIRPPQKNFFHDTIPYGWQFDTFVLLAYWMNAAVPRSEAKAHIDTALDELAENIEILARHLQRLPEGWSDKHTSLPMAQRRWLDKKYLAERYEDTAWINDVSRDFASWVIRMYHVYVNLKNNTVPFSDDEHRHIADSLRDILKEEVWQIS